MRRFSLSSLMRLGNHVLKCSSQTSKALETPAAGLRTCARLPWIPSAIVFSESEASIPHHVRSYGKQALESSLVDVLKNEIAHEEGSYLGEEVSSKNPPAPFKLTDRFGTAEIVLRRKYGNENIEVIFDSRNDDFDADEFKDEEDEDEDKEETGNDETLLARISISKENVPFKLEFDVNYIRNSWVISGVTRNVLDKEDKLMPYEGPAFAMLDPKLQEEFQNFLERRGINTELAEFIRDCMNDKEQSEYLRWLKDISSFITK